MDSLQDNKISYETPDFTNVTFEPKEDTSNHNPLEEEFKKTKEENIENEKDPKIKIIWIIPMELQFLQVFILMKEHQLKR